MAQVRRREVVQGLAGGLAVGAGVNAGSARAQLPHGALRIVVGVGPGSASDLVARIVAQKMSEVLGQSVVVDNRTGGGGIVAVESVKNAPKDGSVLVIGTATTLIVHPILNKNVTFEVSRDFAGVSGLVESPFVILTGERPDAPKDFVDLVARLESSDANYGSLGIGTYQHLIAESLLQRVKRRATHIPYRGSSPQITALMQGDLLFGVDSVAGSRAAVQSRQVRALAVTSAMRVPSMPDVPTLTEALGSRLVVTGWGGLFAPAGTPPAALRALEAATLRALADQETISRLAPLSLDPLPITGQALMEKVRSEVPFWADIIRTANVRIEN